MSSDPNNRIEVARSSDQQILAIFDALKLKYACPPPSIQLIGLPLSFSEDGEAELISTLRSADGFSISQASMHFKNMTITYERGTYTQLQSGVIRVSSPLLDTVSVNVQSNSGLSPSFVYHILEDIRQHVALLSLSQLEAVTPALQSSIASHHSMVERLERTLTDIASTASQRRATC